MGARAVEPNGIASRSSIAGERDVAERHVMRAPPTARLRPLLQLQARLDDDVTPHRHFLANTPGQALRALRTDVEANTAQLVDDRRW